jgi:hypothetical protein
MMFPGENRCKGIPIRGSIVIRYGSRVGIVRSIGDRRVPTRRNILARSFVLAATLAACASDVDVSTTVDPLSSFPAQATYVWDDAAIKLPADPRIRELDPDSLIREAANAEFAARGYRRSAGGPAQYRLAYDFAVHTWHGVDDSSSVGSLSLWLSDAANRRVWMGYARAELHVGLSREERLARLREAIARMLEDFPPKQRAAGSSRQVLQHVS